MSDTTATPARLKCRFCSWSIPREFVPRKGARPRDALGALGNHVTEAHWDRLTLEEKQSLVPGWRERVNWTICPTCKGLLEDNGFCRCCGVMVP